LHLKGGEQERRVVAIELPELVVVDHTVSVVVNLIPVGEASLRVHVVERAGVPANEWGESAMGGAGTWLARMSRSEQQTRRSKRSDGGDGVWYLPSALSRACGVKQRGVARGHMLGVVYAACSAGAVWVGYSISMQ